jgi:hypothetical protein
MVITGQAGHPATMPSHPATHPGLASVVFIFSEQSSEQSKDDAAVTADEFLLKFRSVSASFACSIFTLPDGIAVAN